MAVAKHSTIAPGVTPEPFNPAAWLDSFRDVGGYWIVGADQRISIGVNIEHTAQPQQHQARKLMDELFGNQEIRSAVRSYLLTHNNETTDPRPALAGHNESAPTTWQSAKLAYDAAIQREAVAARKHSALEDALQPYWNAPSCKFTYNHKLGDVNGVDVGSTEVTVDLTRHQLKFLPAELRDHPEVVAFKMEVEEVQQKIAEIRRDMDADAVESAWASAVDARLEAWRLLAATPTTSVSDLIQKVESCMDDTLECDGHQDMLTKSILRDLKAIEAAGA